MTTLARLRFGLQRERALVALFALDRKKTWGTRLARVYAGGVCVSYAGLLLFVGRGASAATLHELVRAALGSLSVAVGALAALDAARALAEHPSKGALGALAVQRGISPRALPRAHVLSAGLDVARLIGIPALLLVGLSAALGAPLDWALTASAGIAVYALLFGACTGIVAVLAAELSPRRPRSMLAGLVLVPWLAAQAYPAIPSLPGALERSLGALLGQAEALT